MKAKAKKGSKGKRDVFAELQEGFEALAASRKGKVTLRTHAVEFKAAPEITPKELVRAREKLRTRLDRYFRIGREAVTVKRA